MAEILGHEIKDWLPQEPNQGPPLPEFLNIYWPWYTPPGAEFKVSNLVISPTEVNPGQVVTISCLVTNTGAEAGSYTVKLGGDFMAEQIVTLQPGESKAVAFEVTPATAKTYNVSVNGLSGSFRAVTTPVAITGSMRNSLIYQNEVTGWETLVSGRQVVAEVPIYIAQGWRNDSSINIIGHMDLVIDGLPLTANKNQDLEAAPGDGHTVGFPAFSLSTGTHTLTFTLSSGGQILATVTFTLVAAAADIRLENLIITPSEVYVGAKVTISVTAKNYGTAAGTKTIVCTVS